MLADNTTGTAKFTLIPGYGSYYGAAATTVTSNWDYPAAWYTTGQTFASQLGQEFRIVSFGAVIRCTMSALTAKGILILTVNPNPALGATQNIKGSMNGAESVSLSLTAGQEYTWRSKPSGPTAHNFRHVSEITPTMTDFDWTSLDIEIVGGDTTAWIPMLSIEVVMNIEFTIRASSTVVTGSGQAQLARTPAPANKLAIAASEKGHSQLSSFISGGINEAEAFLSKKASTFLDDVLSDGMAFLGLL